MNTANHACLAQLVERKTFNLVVMGSSPMVGKFWREPIKKIPHSALVQVARIFLFHRKDSGSNPERGNYACLAELV